MSRIGGLIVTHGRLGELLVEECRRIMGEVDLLESLSTHAMSAIELSDRVRSLIGTDPWIVFVDAPGTAPAVRSQVAISSGQAVITGVNLPILFSFLAHRENLPLESLARKLAADGKRSMELLWPLSRQSPGD